MFRKPAFYLGAAAVVFLILAGIFGLRSVLLANQRAELAAEVEALSKKGALFQRRLNEANAELSRYMGQAAAQQSELSSKADSLAAERNRLRSVAASEKASKESLLEQTRKLEANRAELAREVDALRQKLAEVEAAAAGSKQLYEAEKKRFARLADSYTKLEIARRNQGNSKDILREQAMYLVRDREECEAQNAKLILVAEELIENYKNKGFMSVFLQKEPLTQVKREEYEDLAEAYRSKVEELRVVRSE